MTQAKKDNNTIHPFVEGFLAVYLIQGDKEKYAVEPEGIRVLKEALSSQYRASDLNGVVYSLVSFAFFLDLEQGCPIAARAILKAVEKAAAIVFSGAVQGVSLAQALKETTQSKYQRFVANERTSTPRDVHSKPIIDKEITLSILATIHA